MKSILSLIISAALVVSSYSQTRNVLVGTNNAVVQPTNFWSADATNARSGLGLGSAATNAASAFQPASSILSNLVSGGALTFSNITIGITNVTGLQTALDGKLSTNPTLAISNISNLQTTLDGKLGTNPTLQISNISGLQTNLDSKLSPTGSAANLTNFPTVALASNITGTAALATNVTGVVALTNGGTGATNATSARTALGVGALDVFVGLTNLGTGAGQGFSSSPYILGSTNSTAPNNAVLALGAAGVRSVAGLTLAALTNLDNASFRSAIGLGSSATNASSAFQPSSVVLSNLASSNGGSLTNIAASNIIGTIAISNGGSGATTAGGARTNLGLGWSALTNINSELFNTAVGLGVSNTVYFAEVGVGRATDGYTMGGTAAITNQNFGFSFKQSGIPFLTISNLTGTNGGALIFHGTVGAATTRANLGFSTNLTSLWTSTNSSNARSAVGLGATWLTNTNVTNFRTEVGLGATNSATFKTLATDAFATFSNYVEVYGPIWIGDAGTNDVFQFEMGATDQAKARTNLGLGSFDSENGFSVIADESNNAVISTENGIPLFYGPLEFNNTTNAAATRTNLGLPLAALTNTNVTNFRTAIGLGASNSPQFTSITVGAPESDDITISAGGITTGYGGISFDPQQLLGGWAVSGAFSWTSNSFAAATRTNLGLGWSALTNSNAGTGLVSVNTNGVVVSPTNFWQVAPIQTLVQDLTVVVTTQTNNATNARNLYIYSLATNVTGISNTILLPTNAATFAGDEVTVIHQGTTNTTTVIRQDGSTNNLITLNRFDEAVKFIRESGQWDFYHNISYVEPIQFSGTNASNNIAATRTNLGLPLTALTNSNTTNFQAAVFQTNTAPVSGGSFGAHAAWMEVHVITNGSNVSFRIPLYK